MTGFSVAQYESVADRLQSGVEKLSQKSSELTPTARKAGDKWYITQKIADAIMWVAKKMEEIAKWLLKKIEEAMVAIFAPVTLFKRSLDWMNDVKPPASTVQGNTDFKALKAHLQWEGPAATTYTNAVRGQSSAAGRISTIAGSVSSSCAICAGAGLLFYIALAAILVKVISATVAALGALVSGFGAPVAAGIFAEEATVDSAAVWAAVSALGVALGTQVKELLRIKSDAQDNSDFPGGKWPKGTA